MFFKGFMFISHCYSLVPLLSSGRAFKVVRLVEIGLKVNLAAYGKLVVGLRFLP